MVDPLLVVVVGEVKVEGGEEGASVDGRLLVGFQLLVDILLVGIWRVLTLTQQWREAWCWGLKLVAGGEDR